MMKEVVVQQSIFNWTYDTKYFHITMHQKHTKSAAKLNLKLIDAFNEHEHVANGNTNYLDKFKMAPSLFFAVVDHHGLRLKFMAGFSLENF
jgi:hypothetical protein